MPLSKQQVEQITVLMDDYIKRVRPDEDLRPLLDIGWRMEKQSIYVFEIRPRWDDNSVIRHHDIAKATWVLKSNEWHIYWKRASGNWDSYSPLAMVVNLQRFIIELENDPHHCFWG